MRPRVLIQDGLLPEVLATLATFVRLLASMDANVLKKKKTTSNFKMLNFKFKASPNPNLVQYRPLPEEPRTVRTPERLLVGVDAQVLGQVGLLAEPLAALRTRVGPRLDVDATVLEQGALLLELLLADRTAHVQRHAGGPTVLDHVR